MLFFCSKCAQLALDEVIKYLKGEGQVSVSEDHLPCVFS